MLFFTLQYIVSYQKIIGACTRGLDSFNNSIAWLVQYYGIILI